MNNSEQPSWDHEFIPNRKSGKQFQINLSI